MFGCFFVIFRSVASFILGLVFFFAFLGLLLVANVRDNFLNAEFYIENLAKHDAYNRIYVEVLLDEEFEDETEELLGKIDVDREDIRDVAREIIPPEYLQDQIEGAVNGTIAYLKNDTDTPDVYLELGPPLGRAKDALFGYMDRRIDELDDVPVTTLEGLKGELERLYREVQDGRVPTQVPSKFNAEALISQSIAELEEVPVSTIEEFRKGLESVYQGLADGKIPTQVPSIENPGDLVSRYVDQSIAELEEVPVSTTEEFRDEVKKVYLELAKGKIPTRIPSIEAIPESLRTSIYDRVFQALSRDGAIPEETIKLLEEQETEIKTNYVKEASKGPLRLLPPS